MSDESYKIGAVGDRDSVLGFLALGFTVTLANGKYESEQAIIDMAHKGFAVIFVTEEVAMLCADTIAKYKKQPLPAITVIPGASGSKGYGMESLRRAVEGAVGSDIL